MAVNKKTFLNNLRGKQFNYSDDFYKLRGEKHIPSNSFSYYLYDVMGENVIIDHKTNNFSNIFLTHNAPYTEWLASTTPEGLSSTKNVSSLTSSQTTVTTLAVSPFNIKNEINKKTPSHNKYEFQLKNSSSEGSENESTVGKYIKNENTCDVPNKYLMFPLAATANEVPSIIPATLGKYTSSSNTEQFQISLVLNNDTCTITHNFGGSKYYLAAAFTDKWGQTQSVWKVAQFFRGVWSTTHEEPSLFWTNQLSSDIYHVWHYTEITQEDENVSNENTKQYEFFVIPTNTSERYYLTRGFTSFDFKKKTETDEFGTFDNTNDDILIAKKDKIENQKTGETDEVVIQSKYDNPTIFTIETLKSYENFGDIINQSFIKYDRSNIIGEINSEESVWNIPAQAVLHHEYNNKDGINIIPLKNTLSYQGNTIMGHYTDNKYEASKGVSFRTYTSLNTGFYQEHGTGNISLNYTFSDQEYEVNEGEDIIIDTTPLGLTESINIEDCAFVANGAFGSNVPWFADKFKMLQNKPQGIDNGTYLCTWLYKSGMEDDNPQWLDRYYNTNKFSSQEEALKAEVIKGYTLDENICKEFKNKGFADFKSRVKISPNSEYKFSRLSKEMVCEQYGKLGDKVINVVKDQRNKNLNLTDGIRFDNNEWRKISTNTSDVITSLNFNTDIYIDPDKRMGINVMGTAVGKGFNITNRTDVSPYHYYSDDDSVYILNNKWEVSNSVNIKDLYGDNVLKVIQGSLFEDIIVISTSNLYLLSFDLKIKSKISLINQILNLEGVGIYNLSQSGVFNGIKNPKGNPFRLLNYPYGDDFTYVNLNFDNKDLQEKTYKSTSFGTGYIDLPRKPHKTSDYVANTQNSGIVATSSNVAEFFAKTNSVLYNNNLYIPYGNNIFKLIFCPDTPKDFEFFTQNIREEYPAAIRVLDKNEYHTNFFDDSFDKTALKEINSIYITDGGEVIGLNFDNVFMSYDKEHLLCSFKPERQLGNLYTIYSLSITNILYDFNDNLFINDGTQETLLALKASTPFMVSKKSFDKFISNEDGYIGMVFNLHSNDGKNNAEFRVYNKNKELKRRVPISSFSTVISLESYNYINEADEEKQVFVLVFMNGTTLYKLEYDCISNEYRVSIVNGISNKPSKFFSSASNNAALLRSEYKNSLYFNLYLPSPYLYSPKVSLSMPIEDFVRGWYNVNVSVDLLNADFTIRLNDHIYKRVYYDYNTDKTMYYDKTLPEPEEEETYSFFTPFAGVPNNTLNHTYYLGTTPKDYGFTMNDVLKNGEQHDPYTCKNSELQNTSFITKNLELNEYQAMRLRNTQINRIILTLPCGERSATDEITRLFKYSGGGAIANDVKLIISGHGLTDGNEIASLRQNIYETLNGNLDAIVRVNKIDFIQQ